MLSEKAQEALHQAGWTPERTVDISKWRNGLKVMGIEVSPAVSNFMRRYAGLKIPAPAMTNLTISLSDASMRWWFHSVQKWLKETWILMIPIGGDGDTHFFMGRDGSLFLFQGAEINRLSYLYEDPMEVLLTRFVAVEVFVAEEGRWMSWEEFNT
jgi:hypothetical protein